jgi:hypothetical protein
MRKHAWEFGKATLPQRGGFKTAYEALQLEACGAPVPEEYDEFKPPTFAVPSTGKVIYVSASAGLGGDGTKARPFHTLEVAVTSATVPGPKTIVLKAGTYYTTGVLLTTAHSNLTIQNEDGGAVVISGAIPVLSSKEKWSVHDATTNTWKLDTKGQRLPTEYGMRVGTRRAIRAKYPNGDPERTPSHAASQNMAPVYRNGSGRSMELPQYFPRKALPLTPLVDFWAHPSDWPGTFWHDTQPGHAGSIGGYGPYFYAAGGVCAGRVPGESPITTLSCSVDLFSSSARGGCCVVLN